MATVTSGWAAGVFRQLRHWATDGARTFIHDHGVTFYAVCGSPCLDAPEVRRIWWDWPSCAICAARLYDVPAWGHGVLQTDVAHAHGPRPGLAMCDTLLITDLPDITHRYDLRACTHCLDDLLDSSKHK
ncbi:hypothetical protein [Actinokineospora sp.]|uniref:hypothetical protein n=1 Tax=Actinokineospora sp. TaxID=1872133 RepID=UPI003D6BF945